MRPSAPLLLGLPLDPPVHLFPTPASAGKKQVRMSAPRRPTAASTTRPPQRQRQRAAITPGDQGPHRHIVRRRALSRTNHERHRRIYAIGSTTALDPTTAARRHRPGGQVMPLKRPCRCDPGTARSGGFQPFPICLACDAHAFEAAILRLKQRNRTLRLSQNCRCSSKGGGLLSCMPSLSHPVRGAASAEGIPPQIDVSGAAARHPAC